ncbi:MAG: O-antigen ligase family protein [Bacteroidales bacterium]
MFSRHVHGAIYFICLLLAAFLMPVSVWILSAVSIAMSINWLLEGDFTAKRSRLKAQPGISYLLLLFAMYLIWLLNTSDIMGAMTELKLKLPLLVFPIVAGTSLFAGQRKLRQVLLAFTGGCVVAVAAGFLALAGVLPAEIDNPRDLALFVPSIRLSILLNFGIFTALWLSVTDTQAGNVMKVALAVAAAAMALFLFRLLSVTGIVLFVILLGGTGLYIALQEKRILAGFSLIAAAVAAAAASVLLVTTALDTLRNPLHPVVNEPMTVTVSGNRYTHYPEETILENGYLVWMNVCEEELRREWNRRSTLPFDSKDKTGNELRTTLVRYITSMGLPKDSAAVTRLTETDISNIEKGYANPVYARKGSPRARAYELAWELDRAARGANPSGHSLTQRPEFYRAATGIIRENPWTGVGTGDVGKAFREEYEMNGTPLGKEYRLRAHNQYLTLAVTFGIPGMIMAVILMLSPWLKCRGRTAYPFMLFISVILVSMLNDDTFSSSTGAAFFSYFYTLLIVTYGNHETQQ